MGLKGFDGNVWDIYFFVNQSNTTPQKSMYEVIHGPHSYEVCSAGRDIENYEVKMRQDQIFRIFAHNTS